MYLWWKHFENFVTSTFGYKTVRSRHFWVFAFESTIGKKAPISIDDVSFAYFFEIRDKKTPKRKVNRERCSQRWPSLWRNCRKIFHFYHFFFIYILLHHCRRCYVVLRESRTFEFFDRFFSFSVTHFALSNSNVVGPKMHFSRTIDMRNGVCGFLCVI